VSNLNLGRPLTRWPAQAFRVAARRDLLEELAKRQRAVSDKAQGRAAETNSAAGSPLRGRLERDELSRWLAMRRIDPEA